MAGPEALVYLNGQFVSESQARVSVFDRGFLYGDGVFETMRSYDGRIFQLDRHMRRLRRSADIIGLDLRHEPREVGEILTRLIELNGLGDAILRISVTRGRATGGIGVARAGEPSIVAFARPPAPLPAKAYTDGVSARIVSIRRFPAGSLDSRVKSMNFLNYILARAEAEESGAYEAIMLNQSGDIAEASTANIFFAGDGRLVTPSLESDILPGITREVTLGLAAEMDIAIEERRIEPPETAGFDECFLTSSGIELLPVTKIDDSPVGAGKPGPIHSRLHEAYRRLAQRG